MHGLIGTRRAAGMVRLCKKLTIVSPDHANCIYSPFAKKHVTFLYTTDMPTRWRKKTCPLAMVSQKDAGHKVV